jgi:SAM-dependent methyltransferase
MSLRADLAEWVALVRRLGPHRVLDLGCGGGRLGAALAREDPACEIVGVDLLDVLLEGPPPTSFVRADMRALPFGRRFDLVAAANDPFAHLVEGLDRARGLGEAQRVLVPGGRLVIDGLYIPYAEATFERRRALGDIDLVEEWHARGDGVYDTRYTYRRGGAVLAEATTRVRAWRADEPALGAVGAIVAGGLDGRPFDPASERFVIFVGGAP